jgi:hypothetical protein
MAWKELKQGHVENVFAIAIVAHHLITYARECTRGKMQSSNYSMRQVEASRADKKLLPA